jgi:RimJ/RimL family protein N-acetyltransferase
VAVENAPHLLTERLDLRLPVAADVATMAAIVAHAETGRYLGAGRTDAAEHFARFSRNAGSWLLYGYGGFMVRERGSGEVIGNCGVFHSLRGLGEDFDDAPEAGWILRHDQVGRGIGHEAMSAALEWFDAEHGPRRVVCMITPKNEPSLRLADKLGFAPLRDTMLPDGEAVRLLERLPPKPGRT